MTGVLCRCAHSSRTNALRMPGEGKGVIADSGWADLRFRVFPGVAVSAWHGWQDSANAVRVYRPSGVQIPEPPPLSSGFTWSRSLGRPLLSASLGPCAHIARTRPLSGPPFTHPATRAAARASAMPACRPATPVTKPARRGASNTAAGLDPIPL